MNYLSAVLFFLWAVLCLVDHIKYGSRVSVLTAWNFYLFLMCFVSHVADVIYR